MEQVKKVRLFATLAAVSGVVAVLFFVPLPNRVFCTLQIEPHGAESVRVIIPGQVEEVLVKPGDQVAKDDVLMRLSNPDIELAIAELEGKRNAYREQIASLQRTSSVDRQTIAGVREGLKAIEEEIAEKQRDRDRLTLRAPVAGYVLPPPEIPRRPSKDSQLPSLFGSPLDPHNDHAYLPESTLVCMIGDPQAMQANLVIDQSQLDFVATGQEAIITLDHLPLDTFHGRIKEIAKSEMKSAPRNLGAKAGGELLTKTDETGMERPWNPSYPALVFPLEGPDDLLRNGLRGRAKINARWQTASQQAWRFLGETFHFKM
jgi:putative peptide zinc metalloprotease protein